MRAIVQERYGSPDVLRLEEVATPVPGEDDVLIRVRAAGVSYPDALLTRGVPYVLRLVAGPRRPRHRVRGSEVAGVVTEVGGRVAHLRPGDEVFGWCGRSFEGGGFAEHARCPAALVARRPEGVSAEQAASLPTSGVTALQAVRDWARVAPGQRVLVNGASGGVGTFAVQIAKALGAEVTGVCGTANLDLVLSIGADHVVDYTRGDLARTASRYDVMIDVPHHATLSVSECRRLLTERGTLIAAANTRNRWIGGFSRVLPARVVAPFVRQRILAPEMRFEAADLAALAAMVAEGRVTPVIERTYTLAEVPAAIRRFSEGHTRGKILVVP